MKKFNNQFATQKLRQEMSVTGTGASFTPGTGEQMATNKAFKKKGKKEEKDVEPKLAAGKAKIYMKDKWGWKDAPSIPNRPSKGGFIYKQLFELKQNTGINPTKLKKFISALIELGGSEDDKKEYKKIVSLLISNKLADAAEEIKLADTVVAENIYSALKTSYPELWDILFNNEKGEPIALAEPKEDLPEVEEIEPEEQDDNEDNYDWFTDTYTEEINESYSKFKTETKTRGKSDQFHQAVRQVRKKVQEINKLFEYVSRLKSELSEGQDGLKYKVHTERALEKIKEMVSELNQNIKKFK